MISDLDEQFRVAMARLAAERSGDLSSRDVNRRARDVGDLFKPIVDRHSLPTFRNYVAENYKLEPWAISVGPNEVAELNDGVLRKLDHRFPVGDRLLIWFLYNPDRSEIDRVSISISRPGEI